MKKTLSILLVGSSGRVNNEIRGLSEMKGAGFEVAGYLDKKGKPSSKKFDVVIDFSQPEGTISALNLCLDARAPLVIATTGYDLNVSKQIQKASKNIPVFVSANMSLGLNLMVESMAMFARKFKGSEVGIEEVHHKFKKDKPSGTAKLIHQSLQKALPKTAKLEEPVSLRGGGVFGIHKTFFFDESEFVVFEHQALNRTVFAKGAVTAAQWLMNKEPGLYGMSDLMGLHRD